MSLNKHKTYYKHVVADQSLFHHCIHLWLLFPESSFKAWMLTWTTEHQPTGNLHPSTKLFTVTHAVSHFSSYLSTMCEKILRYVWVLVRQMAKLLFMCAVPLHISKPLYWVLLCILLKSALIVNFMKHFKVVIYRCSLCMDFYGIYDCIGTFTTCS